ncbi:ABC transporter permease [Luteitalea sp.]
MIGRRPRAVVEEFDEDVAAHLELAELEFRQQGCSEEEARRRARLQFGNLRVIRDDVRDAAGWPRLEALWLDVRTAVHRVRLDASTSLVAGLLLAVAVALASTMFTVADALLLRPAPFRSPETLMRVSVGPATRPSNPNLGVDTLRALREAPGLEHLHVAAQQPLTFTDGDLDVHVAGALVTPEVFDDFGVTPIRGRTFSAADPSTVTDDVVVISETLWRTRFGARADIIGSTIDLPGSRVTVLGVVPQWFVFPTSRTQVWRPLDLDAPDGAATRPRGTSWAYARVSATVPPEAAQAAMTRSLVAGGSDATTRVALRPITTTNIDPYSVGIIRLTSGGVALVFLLLCSNAAALLLTRMRRRRRLMALCATLGAPRYRLLRQAFVEQTVIASLGVVCGTGLTYALVHVVRAWLPQSLSFTSLNVLDVDGRTLAVAALLGSGAVMLCGMVPAWFGRRAYAAPQRALNVGSDTERVAGHAPTMLIVAQTSLALLLCVGAAVQWTSLAHLLAASRGIDVDRLVTFDLTVPTDQSGGADVVATSLAERAATHPDVERASTSFGALPRAGSLYFADVSSDDPDRPPVSLVINSYQVTPDFYRTYGIRLLSGRVSTPADGPDAIVLGRSLARQIWGREDVSGRAFRFEDGRTFTVTGVAADVLTPLLDPRQDEPEMYEPLPTSSGTGPSVLRHLTIRCRATCPDVQTLRRHVIEQAPGVRVSAGTHVRDEYEAGVDRPRAAAAVAAGFAVVGTLGAAAGLLVVLARAAASRQHEFGVRLALGATPASIAWFVRRTTLLMLVTSVLVSLALAWPLGRLLQRVQHETSIADPQAWLMSVAAVAAAAALATIRPARQAARAQPVTLLREP